MLSFSGFISRLRITMKKNKDPISPKQLLKIWSEQIRIENGNKCEICGSTKNTNVHHIISRHLKISRLLKENGIVLCARHHRFDKLISPHAGPLGFYLWFFEKYPDRAKFLLSLYGQI